MLYEHWLSSHVLEETDQTRAQCQPDLLMQRPHSRPQAAIASLYSIQDDQLITNKKREIPKIKS